MKVFFSTLTLLGVLVFGTRGLQAQAYGPYYDPYLDVQYQQYLQWQQYLQYLQQYDPYYELHVMHYQLYLQQYQPYQIYQHCCYSLGVIVPGWSNSIGPRPQAVISPRSQATRRR